MKKIAFIATTAGSFNSLYRGQLEYLKNFCSLTLISGGDKEQIQALKDRNVGSVIKIPMARPPRPFKDLCTLIRLIWFLLFNRFDLVVVTTPKAILLGSIAAALTLQKKRVAFFQGRVYENYTDLSRIFYTFFDYIAILLSHQSLFVSPSLFSAYKNDIPLSKKKGLVLGKGSGNGVDIDWFSKKQVSLCTLKSIRKELNIDENDFTIISIGRICRDKGLYEIAEITRALSKKYSNIKLIMLGRIEDNNFLSEYEDLITSGIAVHVDAVTDIRPYLTLANIHLFLTHREGFGNVAIEAAAMGVPTIAFDVIGVKDSVVQGVSGLKVPFKNNQAVINQLSLFIEQPDLLTPLSKSAHKWVIENYSQKKVWKLYKQFYLKNVP